MVPYLIKIYKTILSVILILIFAACATIEKPNGGPSDRTPPQILSATPSDSTVNFNYNKIIITFDEFIKLNNPNSQIIINPFQKEKPSFTVQGKKLKIELKDTLLKNTTYHIFFGNAIQDITESNPAAGVDYVFSTGAFLDSCSLSGFAGDAFTNKSTNKAWVMLYHNLSDLKDTTPVYITHVNENGAFKFRNISPGKYYLCALEESNSNFKYDMPDEKIAFIDTAITLSTDRNVIDSLKLYLFAEKQTKQKHLKTEMTHYHTVRSSFRITFENPQITLINQDDNTVFVWNNKKDSVTFYVKNKDIDSLKYIITDNNFCDTISQALKFKGRQKNFSTDTLIKLTPSSVRESISPNERFCISSNVPIEQWDTSKIILSINKDTIAASLSKLDEIGQRWELNNEIKPGENASLVINKGAATDIYGYANDSIKFNFKMLLESETGTLQLNLINLPNKPLIISASSKEKTYKIFSEGNEEQIIFSNMLPSEYELKIIVDENNDGEWTHGIFDELKQAEKVFTLARPVQIKKNWETKQNWNLDY